MLKMKIVKQHDMKDCGVCALKSIIAFYGGEISLERLRLDTHTSESGTTALSLVSASKRYGFDSYGIKIDTLEKDDLKFPAIAHVTTKHGVDHFVVIYGVTKDKVHLMDPARGKVIMKKDEFMHIWNNILLQFYPKRKIIFMPKENSLWHVFLKILMAQRKLFLMVVLTSILFTIFTILSTYYFKMAIESISSFKSFSFLKLIILLFGVCILFKLLLGHLRKKLEMHLNKNIDVLLYREFLAHIFYLPLEVVTSRTSGEIASRVHEMENIKNLFTEIIIACGLDLLLMFTSIPILYSLSNHLFLILLFMMIIYLIVGLISSKMIYKMVYRNIEEEAEFNGCLIEQIGMMHTIKNLHQEHFSLRKLEMGLSQFFKTNFDLMKFVNQEENIKLWIYEVGLFLINTVGFILIYKNRLSIANLVTFNTLVVYFLDPVKNVIDSLPKYNFIKATFSKMNDFLGVQEEKMGESENILDASITFKNVCFSYDAIHPVLEKFNIFISSGGFVLLKGGSGSGKSTVCKILEHYITDYEGEIIIGKTNLKDYNLATIRKNIVYISQKERIFTGSIKDNILMQRNVSKEKFDKVCEICEIEKIVSKKAMRYETVISEESSFISGGERQRIILARGLLNDAKIYLIDEALSEVDDKTEQTMIKNMQTYLKEKTVVYITHKRQEKLFENILSLEENYGL